MWKRLLLIFKVLLVGICVGIGLLTIAGIAPGDPSTSSGVILLVVGVLNGILIAFQERMARRNRQARPKS